MQSENSKENSAPGFEIRPFYSAVEMSRDTVSSYRKQKKSQVAGRAGSVHWVEVVARKRAQICVKSDGL